MAVKTIGTGGDYTTVQAWEDALLAVLLEAEEGQCKNQEFSGAGTIVDFSAHDTALGALTLTTEAGASFKDNANVRTNALRYNASNGAALRSTNSYTPVIYFSGAIDIWTISKLQVRCDGPGTGSGCIRHAAGSSSVTLKDLILEDKGGVAVVGLSGATNCRIDNVVAIARAAGGDGIRLSKDSGGTYIINGCTVVRPSNIAAAGNGIFENYATSITVLSTVIAGFTADAAGNVYNAASDYNATTISDGSSGLPDPATDHNVYSITYDTALFVQPSDAGGTHDFKTLTDSALANTGVLDATNAPDDISGTARANPPEIGAWELASAGGTSILRQMINYN